MHKTRITITVLSEDKIPEGMDIGDVAREYDQGDFVLYSVDWHSDDVSNAEMARLLTEAGSDPGFFQLDHL